MIVFKAHIGPVYAVAFSPPDGLLLATGGGDGLVRVWNRPGEPDPPTMPGPGSALAFSPCGQELCCGGPRLRVWDLDAIELPFIDVQESVDQCCFSPDGRILVTQGGEQPLRRRWLNGQELPGGWGGTRESNAGQRFPLGCVAYHPDGSVIASGFAVYGNRRYESAIYLWDAMTGEERGRLLAPCATPHPTAIAFSPDGRFLAGIYGPFLRVWNVSERLEAARRKVGLKHFKGLAFTPDGTRLVTVSNDETVRLWETASWSEAGGFEWKVGKLICVAVSPDGMRMAAGSGTGKVVVWDVD